MQFLASLLVSTVAVLVTAYLTPGAQVESIFTAMVVAIVLGFMNAVVKPILVILTLPISIVTLGLFTLILNLVILVMVDGLVPGFSLGGLLPTILFAIILSVVNSGLASLTSKE